MLRIIVAGILMLVSATGCVDLTHSSVGPATQGDKIRAQVDAGLQLAQQYETPVSEAIFRQQLQDPHLASINDSTLQLRLPRSGKYVESVTVSSGLIVVRYGHKADSAIAGKELALSPANDQPGNVVWICGRASLPPGPLLVPRVHDYRRYTTVEDLYLPESCRQ
jgi:hypothetical protein